MSFLKWVVAILLWFPSFAGINHGLSTALPPGNWTCIRSLASGTCGTATTQYFNAACDGSTDDTSAFLAWITYGISLGVTQAKLYIPPGSACTFSGEGCITTTCSTDDPVVQNALIWAYGATWNNIQFGGLAFYEDGSKNSQIVTANIGDTVLKLNTSTDSTKFSAGRWILVDGISLQKGGNPPNFGLYEWHAITNVHAGTTSGGGGDPSTVTIDAPLVNQFLSTWPQIDDAFTGGPATIHMMQPSWNATLEVHGGTVLTANSVNIKGRTNTLIDVNIPQPAPSANQTVTAVRGKWDFPEIDKDITTLSLSYISGHILSLQSASPVNLFVANNTWQTSIAGTAKNTTITNTTMGGLRVGPTGFGQGGSLTVDHSTFSFADSSIARNVPLSELSYDGAGTLSIAHSSGAINSAWASFIPGATYFLGANDGSDVSTPHTTFTATALTDDGTNLKLAITCVSNCSTMPAALPTATCQGPSCLTLGLYAQTVITQTNTGTSPSLANFAVH